MKHLVFLSVVLLLASCAVPLDQINGSRQTGQVILKIDPPNAKVYLDGAYIGRADKFDGTKHTLPVVLGGHVLQFKADDYENELREIISSEKPVTVEVKMLPKPQAPKEEKEK